MNFERRQFYCRAMGIDTWVARRSLPGAASGHRIAVAKPLVQSEPESALPDTVRPHRQSAGRSKRDASHQHRIAELTSVLTGDPVVDDSASKPASHQRPLDHAPAPFDSIEAFEIVCIQHHDVLLIDDVRSLNTTQSAYTDWLNMLLIAMGRPILQRAVDHDDKIAWPPASSPAIKQHSPQAASEMVQAWLQRKKSAQFQTAEIAQIVLMGAAPQRLLLSSGSEAGLALFPGVPVLSTHDSSELWSAPVLKKAFWQQLLGMHG